MDPNAQAHLAELISSHNYGSIGVVMVLLSYLIAIGVCLHLGAVVGRLGAGYEGRPRQHTVSRR